MPDEYQLGRMLGTGAQGTVCSGRDIRIGRIVAVKIVRAELTDGDERAPRASAFRFSGDAERLRHADPAARAA